jgi:hypothetical protein
MSFILRLAALICFILEVFGVHVDFSLIALGLALWVGSTLVDNPWGAGPRV